MIRQGRLLIVDNEKSSLRHLEQALRKDGYDVVGIQTGSAALSRLGRERFDLVLTLLSSDRIDGMRILRACRESSNVTEVIILSAISSVEVVVDAMRRGAFSYIAKPFRLDDIRRQIAQAMDRVRKRQMFAALSSHNKGEEFFLTQNATLLRLLSTARQVAKLDCPVLIVGEQGTGRRALARTLHQLGKLPGSPFESLRCSAHDPATLESKLFGQRALQSGTLLLEEIEILSPAMQARLSMALDPPGSNEQPRLKARLIVSTNADLDALVRDGAFRQDLHLMLRVVTLTLPPLIQRREDIPLLALHFMNRETRDSGRPPLRISDDALELLAAYDYPGNVRELDTIIRGAVAVCDADSIEPRHLPPSLRNVNRETRSNRLQTLEEREREYILWVLEEVGGNQTLAAKALGIDRASLWRKLKRYENEKGKDEN
jgi:DNA-binding NtrC family response regulator